MEEGETLKNIKQSNIIVPYFILVLTSLILIRLNLLFPKIDNPSLFNITSKFLICIQPAIWIYFEKAGFRNNNYYKLMLSGFILFYLGSLQNIMDEIYRLEGVLSEVDNILMPLGLVIISSAVILRFLEEEEVNLLLSQKNKALYYLNCIINCNKK